MSESTIFDDVFRTIQERMPKLLIPLVNEVFGATYPEEMEVMRLPEEYQKVASKVVADSCSKLGEQIYHFECQSTVDGGMVLRMIEYDFMLALADCISCAKKKRLRFPKSCIIYLRTSKNVMLEEGLEIEFSDGRIVEYKVPILKLKAYTIDEIFEKNLLILLPYYIINYEEELSQIAESKEKIDCLQTEYGKILLRLQEEMSNNNESGFRDMIQLMRRILMYMLRKEPELRKGMEKVMGGKVLRLPSDRLREERAAGVKQGIQQGICGLIKMCQDFQTTQEEALRRIIDAFEIPQKEAEKYIEEYWK